MRFLSPTLLPLLLLPLLLLILLSSLIHAAPALVRQSKGARCGFTRECLSPLSCVGPESKKQCLEKVGYLGACGQNPYSVCKSSLLCRRSVCVPAIGVAGSCNEPGDLCQQGLMCVGNDGNKRCFMKKALGMACGKDPFWVCDSGLRCLNGTCVKAIRQGGNCNKLGDVCQEGFSCVGNVGNKKCFMKKPVGMPCGKDPFWVCRNGLRCLRGVCVRTIARGRSCNLPGSVCAEGLSCVGNLGNKKCFMRKPVGMPCGKDPFWVCRHGLRCIKNVCVRTVNVGQECNSPEAVCPEGTSCVGNEGNRKCFAKKEAGMRCGKDPFWVCRNGLRCAGGICKV